MKALESPGRCYIYIIINYIYTYGMRICIYNQLCPYHFVLLVFVIRPAVLRLRRQNNNHLPDDQRHGRAEEEGEFPFETSFHPSVSVSSNFTAFTFHRFTTRSNRTQTQKTYIYIYIYLVVFNISLCGRTCIVCAL